jgi:hypothetical protein
MSTLTLELAQFVTDPAQADALLNARPGAIAALRSSCSGLISAQLFRDAAAPGKWIEVVLWASYAEALVGAETAMTLPAAQGYFSFITEPPVLTHATLASGDPG